MGSSITGKGTLDYLQPEAPVKGTAEGWLFFCPFQVPMKLEKMVFGDCLNELPVKVYLPGQRGQGNSMGE